MYIAAKVITNTSIYNIIKQSGTFNEVLFTEENQYT